MATTPRISLAVSMRKPPEFSRTVRLLQKIRGYYMPVGALSSDEPLARPVDACPAIGLRVRHLAAEDAAVVGDRGARSRHAQRQPEGGRVGGKHRQAQVLLDRLDDADR